MRLKFSRLSTQFMVSYIVLAFLTAALWQAAPEAGFSAPYFVFSIAILLLCAALASMYFERRIEQPLSQIKHGAERFANGDLSFRMHVDGSDELRGLSRALNRVGAHLQERIEAAINQRNELEAILRCMKDSVILVDPDEKIVRMNQAASNLLGIESTRARGRSMQEAIRHPALQDFVRLSLEDGAVHEAELTLGVEQELLLKAFAAPIPSSNGGVKAVLLVLNDHTRIEHLERMRRDFVANVSHELKTPITSIKGFVETLLDGALTDEAEARRFLEIVARHSERLNTIIDELLTLSRIELGSGKNEIDLEPAELHQVLSSAIEVCAFKAAQKGVTLSLECSPELRANLNVHLMEQAVTNLIDNAIKYSPEKGIVRIYAGITTDNIVISVDDHGPGIEKQHLTRLFERFYRVDKARSRQLGGTGLGLAIVKHIAQAHKGSASVSSSLGQGSSFKIHLPLTKPE